MKLDAHPASLPLDILLEIVQHYASDRNTLSSLSVTSRELTHPCQKLIFSTICLGLNVTPPICSGPSKPMPPTYWLSRLRASPHLIACISNLQLFGTLDSKTPNLDPETTEVVQLLKDQIQVFDWDAGIFWTFDSYVLPDVLRELLCGSRLREFNYQVAPQYLPGSHRLRYRTFDGSTSVRNFNLIDCARYDDILSNEIFTAFCKMWDPQPDSGIPITSPRPILNTVVLSLGIYDEYFTPLPENMTFPNTETLYFKFVDMDRGHSCLYFEKCISKYIETLQRVVNRKNSLRSLKFGMTFDRPPSRELVNKVLDNFCQLATKKYFPELERVEFGLELDYTVKCPENLRPSEIMNEARRMLSVLGEAEGVKTGLVPVTE